MDTQSIWCCIGLTALAAWLAASAGIRQYMSWPRHIEHTKAQPPQTLPRVSVIVPARNEAGAIEACLSSLLRQDYANLEIIAIDDRSTDETGRIMDKLAATNDRLRVLHVDALPENWLGKNHANAVGVEEANGDWFLFTDGDVVFSPSCVTKAIAYAEAEHLDYLTLTPGFDNGGFWEIAASCCFGVLLSAYQKLWHMRNPLHLHCFCGVGAFSLVRREAYSATGGHEARRLEVADDLMLAKAIKQAGRVGDIMSGRGEITIRWQIGLRGVVRGLEKNAFAGADYSVPKAVANVAILLAAGLIPICGILLTPGYARIAFAALYLSQVSLMAKGADVQGLPRRVAFVFPIMCLVLAYAVLRSTAMALMQGGIYWREHFYSLDMLRAARRSEI